MHQNHPRWQGKRLGGSLGTFDHCALSTMAEKPDSLISRDRLKRVGIVFSNALSPSP
jgi:hypothetical protein